MTDEQKEQLKVFVRFIFVFVFAALYAYGGIEYKWLRRFVAPAELSLGMFIFSRDWRVFIQMPFMMASLSIGYGSDIAWIKIVKRLLWGISNGITSSGYSIISALGNSHLWTLVFIQNVLVILSVVLLGVFNPLVNARAEEFTIGCLIALLPMMSVRRK